MLPFRVGQYDSERYDYGHCRFGRRDPHPNDSRSTLVSECQAFAENGLFPDGLNAKRWDGASQKAREEHVAAILAILSPATVPARVDTGVYESPLLSVGPRTRKGQW